jgi:murein DD-endopeptidase
MHVKFVIPRLFPAGKSLGESRTKNSSRSFLQGVNSCLLDYPRIFKIQPSPRLRRTGIKIRVMTGWLAIVFLPTIALATPILHLPVDCKLGEDCFVTSYPDASTGVEPKDFRCGGLAYAGLDSTIFRLKDEPMMEKGVEVRSPERGVVKFYKFNAEETDSSDLCGNHVVISHEGGYESTICGLMENSLTVIAGDKVYPQQKIGLVGHIKGNRHPSIAYFLKKDGYPVDPFTGKFTGKDCGSRTNASLWAEDAKQIMQYPPTALVRAGIATEKPDIEGVQHGRYDDHEIGVTSDIYLWAEVTSPTRGDILYLELSLPDGRVYSQPFPQLRPYSEIFQYVAAKADGLIWSEGTVTAKIYMINSNKEKIFEKTMSYEVR